MNFEWNHSWKHLPAENFCDFSLCLCLQMCLNMADPIQLSGMDGSYVDNKIVSFTHLNWDWMKEFPVLIFLPSFSLYQGTSTKNTEIRIYIMFTTPRK